MEAIDRNYGANVRELKVVSSSWLKPKSEVIVKAIGVRGGSSNERWRCLGTGRSSISDLSVIER